MWYYSKCSQTYVLTNKSLDKIHTLKSSWVRHCASLKVLLKLANFDHEHRMLVQSTVANKPRHRDQQTANKSFNVAIFPLSFQNGLKFRDNVKFKRPRSLPCRWMFRDSEYANYIQVERSNFRKTFGKGWVRVVGGERGVDIFNKNKWRLKSVYSAAINFSFTTRMCEN